MRLQTVIRANRVAMYAVRRSFVEAHAKAAGIPLWDVVFAVAMFECRLRGHHERVIKSGVRAKLTCADPKLLAPEFVGREFDEQLLSEFPPDIDPCGENGEFHTFVYAGPMFHHDLSVKVGEIASRAGFAFADLSFGRERVSTV